VRLRRILRVATKITFILSLTLLVAVLLAAVPRHHAPTINFQEQGPSPQQPPAETHDMQNPHHNHATGAATEEEKASEADAIHDTSHGRQHQPGPHIQLTPERPATPEDRQRAEEVLGQLRLALEKYKDYRAALADGYKVFLPNIPQPEYHFTNYWNGFLQAFTFDPARPTSLLYKKTGDGYELVGAMYTMPKRATEDDLDARIPLSVARWHLHTNLCMPPREQVRNADWTKFGLRGSIATKEACDAAGGRFRPSVFGWMVHVYPYEGSVESAFAMHHGNH
jgi:hypothetical protein